MEDQKNQNPLKKYQREAELPPDAKDEELEKELEKLIKESPETFPPAEEEN